MAIRNRPRYLMNRRQVKSFGRIYMVDQAGRVLIETRGISVTSTIPKGKQLFNDNGFIFIDSFTNGMNKLTLWTSDESESKLTVRMGTQTITFGLGRRDSVRLIQDICKIQKFKMHASKERGTTIYIPKSATL